MHNKRYYLVWFFVGLPIIVAALASQAMWGYVLGRPAPLTDDFATIESITQQTVAQASDGTLQLFGSDDIISTCDLHAQYEYMPNDLPLFRAAADIYDRAPTYLSYDKVAAHTLSRFLNTEKLTFAPAETSYALTENWLYKGRAITINGHDHHGDPLLHISLTTSELHNDDYIFYEYLLRPTEYGYDILASQQFNYHVAGMEGFEFPVTVPLFMLLALPLIMGSWLWARRGGEKRKRHYLIQ